MTRVPKTFSRRTRLGKLVAKLSADVAALAAIPPLWRDNEGESTASIRMRMPKGWDAGRA